MTAPYSAPESPTGRLVATIFQLRQLQNQDAATKLAQQHYELAKQQLATNTQATHENQVTELSKLLTTMQDPTQLLPHIPELSQNTGFSQPFLQTLINQTQPSVETTKAGAVSKGAARGGEPLQDAAASANLTGGALPGAVGEDALKKHFLPSVQKLYDGLDPKAKSMFDKGVLQKVGTGEDLKSATLGAAIDQLSPEDKAKYAKIGAGLIPNASEDAQIRLGWAQLNELTSRDAANSGNDAARISAMLAEAKMKLKGEQLDKVNAVLKDMAAHLQYQGNASSTFTPFGKRLNNLTQESYQEMLRQLAPNLFGPQGTIPLPTIPQDQDMTATGVFNGILQNLKKP